MYFAAGFVLCKVCEVFIKGSPSAGRMSQVEKLLTLFEKIIIVVLLGLMMLAWGEAS